VLSCLLQGGIGTSKTNFDFLERCFKYGYLIQAKLTLTCYEVALTSFPELVAARAMLSRNYAWFWSALLI
jgi:hypothetical protein